MKRSTQELAQLLGVTPRMINIYRAKAEQVEGRQLGMRYGRTIYFDETDQEAITKVQLVGVSASDVRSQQRQVDYSTDNAQAEELITGGMSAIVAAGDQNAIAIGQGLGQRWNHLLWTSAIQEMQGGMIQMQQSFTEMHASVTVSLNSQPQLPGSAALLEGLNDEP